MIATVVDTSALLKTVVAAAVAGIGVSLVFSVAILGASRFVDMARDGRTGAALASGAVAVVALGAAAAVVVVGIIVMASK